MLHELNEDGRGYRSMSKLDSGRVESIRYTSGIDHEILQSPTFGTARLSRSLTLFTRLRSPPHASQQLDVKDSNLLPKHLHISTML
jgi:hypothetical protein